MTNLASAHYGNGGASAYLGNERLAAEDAQRRAYLDRACKAPEPKHCRHCLRELGQANKSGICGSSRCYRAQQAMVAGKTPPKPTTPRPTPRPRKPQWPSVVAGLSVRELRRLGQLVLEELAERGSHG